MNETREYDKSIYERNISKLITTHYPRVDSLDQKTKQMILEQLSWVQQYNQFTPQANVLYDATFEFNKHLHIETFRALTRIEQLLLITDPTAIHYEQFVKDQDVKIRLSLNGYDELKKIFQINKTECDALIRATLIASIPLSPPAKEYMKTKLPDAQYPCDSVQFSGFTMAVCPEMYPAYTETSDDTQQLIHYCFPNDKRHWRHMFYLENLAAFDAFVAADPKPAELRFWVLYWLLNAIGMNGHISPTSARFYEQSVHDRAIWLRRAMQQQPATIVNNYSSMIVAELEVTTDSNSALLLARILSMTNRVSHHDAETLLHALQQNSQHKIITTMHNAAFSRKELGITYLPALLGNLWSLTHNEQHLIAAMHFYSQLALAHTGPNPLSFRLVTKDVLQVLLAANFNIEAVKLNKDGEIELNLDFGKQRTLTDQCNLIPLRSNRRSDSQQGSI